MAAPPVTVITSTYNWPRALARAIPTVLAQTFEDFEYLIIGDCCTDETEDMVRAIDDPRIVWRNLPENTGNQSGVNRIALEMARGEYIAYLNHDDLWFPDHLETALGVSDAFGFDVVNTLALEIGADGSQYRNLLGMPFAPTDTTFDVHPMTSTIMHSAGAAEHAGGWIDWRETKEVPTQDFFRRLRAVRGHFSVISALTVLKFHSGDRLNSYALKDGSEQEYWAARMRTEPDLRYREMMLALSCGALGEQAPKLSQPAAPTEMPPGWQIEQWRRMRGLAPMLDLGGTEPGAIAPLPQAPASFIYTDPDGPPLIAPVFRSPSNVG